MSFGRKINLTAIKLAQHCFSYFTFLVKDNISKIIEFPSYHKTTVLGAIKKMTKPIRKKWNIQKAIKILENRNDIDTLGIINSRIKMDDLSDVICQLQAFKILQYYK